MQIRSEKTVFFFTFTSQNYYGVCLRVKVLLTICFDQEAEGDAIFDENVDLLQ